MIIPYNNATYNISNSGQTVHTCQVGTYPLTVTVSKNIFFGQVFTEHLQNLLVFDFHRRMGGEVHFDLLELIFSIKETKPRMTNDS